LRCRVSRLLSPCNIAISRLYVSSLSGTSAEGYESIVFKGARDILSKPKAPIIIFEFCDWAEDRAQNLEIGDAQRILVEFGYKIWRLNDILNQKKPLNHIVEHGSDTLIAIKSN